MSIVACVIIGILVALVIILLYVVWAVTPRWPG